jgi:dihydropteroate synthase
MSVDASAAVKLPAGAGPGIAPLDLGELRIGPSLFRWGLRTYVMGIVNVTPDSFSGDGLLAQAGGTAAAGGSVVAAAVTLARRMVAEGADLLDVGGASSRPGHEPIPAAEERSRVLPVVEALHEALPQVPLSIDTTKAEVAAAALDAGAHLINDVWGVAAGPALLALAAERGVPVVLMHNRAEARYGNVLAEVIADLEGALERAEAAGVAREAIVLDPGIGFGKTPEQNLALLHDLASLQVLRRPILLGTSRKSTIGRVLDLPARERLEGTLATTALGVAAGVDIVRVHDVEANVRVARMADAVVRGTMPRNGALRR